MADAAELLVSILMIIFAILMIIGLVYLTPLAFGTKRYESLSSTQKTLMKFFIIVTWIGVIISLLSSLFGVARGRSQSM